VISYRSEIGSRRTRVAESTRHPARRIRDFPATAALRVRTTEMQMHVIATANSALVAEEAASLEKAGWDGTSFPHGLRGLCCPSPDIPSR
jgi:hypothetical protein